MPACFELRHLGHVAARYTYSDLLLFAEAKWPALPWRLIPANSLPSRIEEVSGGSWTIIYFRDDFPELTV